MAARGSTPRRGLAMFGIFNRDGDGTDGCDGTHHWGEFELTGEGRVTREGTQWWVAEVEKIRRCQHHGCSAIDSMWPAVTGRVKIQDSRRHRSIHVDPHDPDEKVPSDTFTDPYVAATVLQKRLAQV